MAMSHSTAQAQAIVTGGESMATQVTSARKPGARGSRQCWCQGQILVMLAEMGWILPLEDIDDAALSKNDGKIYVDTLDIQGGAQLAKGDIVGFYVFVDELGLQAEDVRCLNKPAASLNAMAPDSVTSGNPQSKPFAPRQDTFTQAKVFMEVPAAPVVPFGIKANIPRLNYTQNVFAMTMQHAIEAYFSDDSDDDSDDSFDEDSDSPTLPVGKATKQRSLSPVASTTAGLSSDDEADSASSPRLEDLPEACLGGRKFRPPPGLTLSSPPTRFALDILARAGLSQDPLDILVKAREQKQEQHQKQEWPTLPSKRCDGKSNSPGTKPAAWTPAWRRARQAVAAA